MDIYNINSFETNKDNRLLLFTAYNAVTKYLRNNNYKNYFIFSIEEHFKK